MVAEDRRLHVRGARDLPEGTAGPGAPQPDGLGFRPGEVREPYGVPARQAQVRAYQHYASWPGGAMRSAGERAVREPAAGG